ncbi:MAG TPA: nuclear transport factor 2 family protein [Xanthomonadaceae bacterium]|jgi:hypothetical protein
MKPQVRQQMACVLCIFGLATDATAKDEAAKDAVDTKPVLAAVQALLDGWRESDAAKLESVLHKDFREVTLHLKDGAWTSAVEDRATLVGTMAKLPKGTWDDHLVDPEVRVDGPIAIVWSHYRFTVHYTENGVAHSPSHCGIETFQLYRTESGWQIINFADTHSDACP